MKTVAPDPPAVAARVFGSRLDLARRYADLLAGAAVVRGLIGPRETPRLWDRHLLNCAVMGELLPPDTTLVDVGSGAGLPGLVLAVARPDLSVVLLDSLRRRTDFLREATALLDLAGRVRVVTGRAEDPAVVAELAPTSWVVARAVAPLDRLSSWCMPLLRPGGHLLALKGAQAAHEVVTHRAALRRAGAAHVRVVTCGADIVDEPATVVAVTKAGG
ncbi:MAG: 16S rRNA (guanine(527)-N(7))-methyltransferase RsmG [bacterium]